MAVGDLRTLRTLLCILYSGTKYILLIEALWGCLTCTLLYEVYPNDVHLLLEVKHLLELYLTKVRSRCIKDAFLWISGIMLWTILHNRPYNIRFLSYLYENPLKRAVNCVHSVDNAR